MTTLFMMALQISSQTYDSVSCLEDIIKTRTIAEHELPAEIDYIQSPISYEEFFLKYLIPNKPCLFGPWATADWRSVKEWVTSEGKPDLEFLSEKFGDCRVPVANCNKEEYQSHPKKEWSFREYLTYFSRHSVNSSEESANDFMYCKDWHFVRDFPKYKAYDTPEYFQCDWLNEFWDAKSDGDDYRFVYLGPKGTWTPLHADVLRSYSWSANVCGCKKWIILPPGEELKFKDRYGNLAFDLRTTDFGDTARYPNYSPPINKLEVVQRASEVIFVPSGWHHQVFNLEDTLSINHNWLNGCNIDISWNFLKSSLADVEHEISDCRSMEGWHNQCQVVLKASSGIDYTGFYELLLKIASHRLKGMKCKQTTQSIEGAVNSPRKFEVDDRTYRGDMHMQEKVNHCSFDLLRIKGILNDMIDNETFTKLSFPVDIVQPMTLLEDICSTV